MKAKDLIKVLQACNPETEVDVTLERCDETRMDIIKKCVMYGSCKALENMTIDGVAVEQGLQGEEEDVVSCILLLKPCMV